MHDQSAGYDDVSDRVDPSSNQGGVGVSTFLENLFQISWESEMLGACMFADEPPSV